MTPRHPHLALALRVCAGFLAGCAGATSGLSITTTAPNGAREQIPATVSRPVVAFFGQHLK
ncbi:MAG TPA: hypothetical protein VGV13_14105 [Methylomirabilota bacterium]|jgi:hypothetical protein|nr:hypothetical protein [Methylomirabilota bacterium]